MSSLSAPREIHRCTSKTAREMGTSIAPSSDVPEPNETVEGYVVDIACLRKYPRSEWDQRAHVHTRECALMGHCVESGYGLVQNGIVTLLDHDATPFVVDALKRSTRDAGVRLRVVRHLQDGEMRTRSANEIS